MAQYPPAVAPPLVESDPIASALVKRAGGATGPLEGLPLISTRNRHVDANKGPTTILSNGVDTTHTSLVKMAVVQGGGGYGLRARFDNFIVSNDGNVNPGEQNGPQAITISATAVLPDGTVVPLRYRGQLVWTVDPGPGLLTDTAGVYVYDGDVISVYTRVSVAAAATKFQLGVFTNAANGEGVDHAAATSLANGNVPAIAATSEYAYGPTGLCVARPFSPTAPRWLLAIGDSITGGFGDIDVDGGHVIRGIGTTMAVLNLARGGDRARWLAQAPQSQRYRRWRFIMDAPDIWLGLGINDVTAGQFNTLADLTGFWQAAVANIQAVNPDARIHIPTITPNATSTDKYLTVVNQTPGAQEGVRVPANEWLRDNAADLGVNVVEVADWTETARNSGVWKVPGVVGQGDIATANGGKTISNVVGNFPNGTILNGTGLAQNTIVTAGGGTSTITIDKAVTQTAVGRAIGVSYVLDGTHPNGNGYPWLAPVMQQVIDAA